MTEYDDASAVARARWPIPLLFAIPFLAIALRPLLPPGVDASLSLAGIPHGMHRHMQYVILVPIGGAVVAFFRLTLGLRVLSFFRPILLAVAFRAIGVPLSLAFLLAVLAGVTLVWPLLRHVGYYERVPILLSVVAGTLVVSVVAGGWWQAPWLSRLGYFPIISLCLICDTFAKVLDEDGVGEAIWRALMTVASGLAITLVAAVPHLLDLWLRYPELLLVQIATVSAIGRHFSFELFDAFRPFGRPRETGEALVLDARPLDEPQASALGELSAR